MYDDGISKYYSFTCYIWKILVQITSRFLTLQNLINPNTEKDFSHTIHWRLDLKLWKSQIWTSAIRDGCLLHTTGCKVSLQTPSQTTQGTKQNWNSILLIITNGGLDKQNVSELYATSSGVTPEIITSEKCYIDMGIIELLVGKLRYIYITQIL